MVSIPPHCILLPLDKGYHTFLSFDDDDLALQRWFAHVSKDAVYVMRSHHSGKRQAYMHILVMERVLGRPVQVGMVVDHINGNSLDNRRYNLREVSKAYNGYNRSKKRHGKAPYKGLKWQTDRSQWLVRIAANGVRHFIGYYDDPVEAACAYDEAAKIHHGEYARLNFP